MDESTGYLESYKSYPLNSFENLILSAFSDRLEDKPELIDGSSSVDVVFGFLHSVSKQGHPAPSIALYSDGSMYGYFAQEWGIDNFSATQAVNCSFCGTGDTPVVSMLNKTVVDRISQSDLPVEVSICYPESEQDIFKLNYVSSIVFFCEPCFEMFSTIREQVFTKNSSVVLSLSI